MLRLRTLGGLGIERDGAVLDEVGAYRKSLALLAILATHESVGRERLMVLLWPESEPERARGSLKQAIHLLRRQLGQPELLLGTAELRLNPEVIDSDVARFKQALEAGDPLVAVGEYGGPFLDGVHLDGTAEFERWVGETREALGREFREALEALARAAASRGDAVSEVSFWRRLQGAEPLSGRVALELIEALDRAGDRPAALRHARVHEVLVREELGVAPDPRLVARVEALRAAPSALAVPSSPPAESPTAQVDPMTRGVGSGQLSQGARSRSRALTAGVLGLLGAALTGLAAWVLIASASPWGADSRSQITSVAVLPFVDMSADGDQAYLADGIAEEILNTLAGIREIRVPARTSSFHFRGRERPIPEIARELGVDAILEGSVRKMGSRIRITAQLIDARVDRHLWSNTFEAEMDDIFAVQSEIAATVSEALRVELALPAGATGRPPTTSMAAYDLYLRGLSHWNRRSAPDLVLAIRFFDEATELDPDFARAWAGLALVHAVLPIGFTPPLPTEVARARLEKAADRALALDSSLAEVHAARGLSYHFAWRWNDAEREFRRALALNPRYATAHQWYGEHQAKLGRGADGVASMRRALELDPLSLVIRNDLGLVLMLDGRMAEAREAWEETVSMDPSFSLPHYFLHRIGIIEGDLEAAEEAGRRWVALTAAAGNPDILILTRAMGDPALREEAMAVLERWEAGEAPRWLDIAFYRTYLDDRDGALAALERGMRARAPMMAQIGHSPWLEPLRGDARFEALVRELDFPPSQRRVS